MNKLLVVTLAILSLISCSEENKAEENKAEEGIVPKDAVGTEALTDENGISIMYSEKSEPIVYFKGEPFTGVRVDTMDNILHNLTNYKNGLVDGLQINFFNKTPIREENYRNNKKHGKTRLYWDDGTLESESNYSNGELHGEYISYDPDGNIKMKAIFKHGARIECHGDCPKTIPKPPDSNWTPPLDTVEEDEYGIPIKKRTN